MCPLPFVCGSHCTCPQWNCGWIKHPTTPQFEALNRFQKVNHFPGSWCIGRKDRLMRCVNRAKRAANNMAGVPGDAFDIIPGGWILPQEYDCWARAASSNKSAIFILKPSASSCGRGIRLVHKNNLNTVPKDKPCVMQEYLHKPYLINKKKFDLRIYVLVTSFDPLKVYIFQEGLCRFSSADYNLRKLNSRYSHLTNYSINKKSKNFVEPTVDNNSDMEGSKWSLTALWRYLIHAEGKAAVLKCQREVKRLMVKTLIAAEGEIAPLVHRHIKNPGSCYELFGFDVFLDKKLKPWLIEVNISPSLMGSSPLDQKIKGTLMADTFHLIGNVPYDEIALNVDKVKEKMLRMSGSFKSRRASASKIKQDMWRRNPTNYNAVNLHELSETDWEMIHTLEDEFSRKGHFTRAFPSHDNADMLCYFQSPRFNNALMMSWLMNGRQSFVKNMHILGNGDAKAKEQLIKFADKKNNAEVQKAERSSSSFESGVAPPCVLVPGHNCASSRCNLPVICDDGRDDASSWLVPLGARTDAVVRAELEDLMKCTSGGDGVEGEEGEDEDDESQDDVPRKASVSTASTASVTTASVATSSANSSGVTSPVQIQEQHFAAQIRAQAMHQRAVHTQAERVSVSAGQTRGSMSAKPLSAGGTSVKRTERKSSAGRKRTTAKHAADRKEQIEYEGIFNDAKLLIAQHLSEVGVGVAADATNHIRPVGGRGRPKNN